MAKATLTISSKNYSSWSLRGWLLTRFSGLEFDEIVTAPDDPSARAEILLLSPTILVPCLRHEGATVWDTPVNLKGHFPNFKIWTRAQADIDRVCTIWRECLADSGGPFLFGERSMADAMYAPVVTRFMTYDVKLDPRMKQYADLIMGMPEMQEWIEAAKAEPSDIEELEVDY
jgi:glutathione S-transferase